MFSQLARLGFEAVLFLLALGVGGAALRVSGSDDLADVLYFTAWCAAIVLLFSLGLRLPLHFRSRFSYVMNAGIILAALGVALLGNIALYRHDAHFDATVTGRFTPPPELQKVAHSLQRDVTLTYFYNNKDEYAYAAKEVLAVAARQYPHLKVRALDLDTEPVVAREYGVRLYNTLVAEADGRRTEVDNTVDLRQVAYAIERVLQQRSQIVCFITGHGEQYVPGHVHYSHAETLGGDEPGGSDTLEAPPDGLDRFKLAIETIGYGDRPIEPATLPAIPGDCAVVADLGPMTGYTPAEVDALGRYLQGGGKLFLAYGPRFPVTPELASLLDGIGLAVGDGVVVDPTNHYGTDQEQPAVPYYPPHPITEPLALTVFPDARPVRVHGSQPGLQIAELIATSRDAYVRPRGPGAAGGGVASVTHGAGPQVLAAAVQGTRPSAGDHPFRVVLIGDVNFATNAFFPYASNGDLAVSIVRWLADDTATPVLKPEAYSLPEMRLTHRQMQVTFLLVEVLLPLSVVIFGTVVWWRRR